MEPYTDINKMSVYANNFISNKLPPKLLELRESPCIMRKKNNVFAFQSVGGVYKKNIIIVNVLL